MSTKTFKGVIQSLLPNKGYGFIAPVWSNGNSNRNIFFSFTETKNGKCYIPALASKEERHEVQGKKGTVLVIPNKPQVVYFNLEVNDKKFVAVNIRDEQHVTEEEKVDADQNVDKPTFSEILSPENEVVDLRVKPELPASKGPMSLEELEAACDRNPHRKSQVKRAAQKEIMDCATVDTEEQTEPVDASKSQPALVFYSEEELQEIAREEAMEEEQEEIDYDEYEEYDNLYD